MVQGQQLLKKTAIQKRGGISRERCRRKTTSTLLPHTAVEPRRSNHVDVDRQESIPAAAVHLALPPSPPDTHGGAENRSRLRYLSICLPPLPASCLLRASISQHRSQHACFGIPFELDASTVVGSPFSGTPYSVFGIGGPLYANVLYQISVRTCVQLLRVIRLSDYPIICSFELVCFLVGRYAPP